MSWRLAGKAVEPPDNEQLLLRRFRKIWSTLDPSSLTGDPDDYGWSFSEADLAGILPEALREALLPGEENESCAGRLELEGLNLQWRVQRLDKGDLPHATIIAIWEDVLCPVE